VHELDGETATPELGVDLKTRAVDHDHLVTLVEEDERPPSRPARDAPSELDDDAAHVVYSAFSRT
jgi:hypothetical protein